VRRTVFIQAIGGGVAVATLPPLTQNAAAQSVVDYTLTAQPVTMTPAIGVAFHGFGYNTSSPGPVLRTTIGQRVRVRFVNRTGTSSTVHWHGMILPNAMDGAGGITQPAVADGASFTYDFLPAPAGTRWYHDHFMDMGTTRGLHGMFIIDDPKDPPAGAEFAIVFHDVPDAATIESSMRGVRATAMIDPPGSPEMLELHQGDHGGEAVAYRAHLINGVTLQNAKPLKVKVGQRVRLRILNANQTQTRYVRLGGQRLHITHADGNPLAVPFDVDALRLGVGERYDAWFEVTKPGAWLLQGITSDPLAAEQAVLICTDGMENAPPSTSPMSLEGVDFLTYAKLGGGPTAEAAAAPERTVAYELGGGKDGSPVYTLNGAAWPNTEKIEVKPGDRVSVHFRNRTDMDHPMHLHGHTFTITEVNGVRLARPPSKDMAIVSANGGSLTWSFAATSPPGRWLLHCHNDVHMMGGMMTEVVYV
jgi:multicopper oxidase